jgi:hypothetical protein
VSTFLTGSHWKLRSNTEGANRVPPLRTLVGETQRNLGGGWTPPHRCPVAAQPTSARRLLCFLVHANSVGSRFWRHNIVHAMDRMVRCAFFEIKLHSRVPLVPTSARLKYLHAWDHWHSSRVFAPLTGCHCTLHPNTEGQLTTHTWSLVTQHTCTGSSRHWQRLTPQSTLRSI